MRRNLELLRFLGWNTQGDLGPWTFYTSKRKGLVYYVKSPPLEPPSRKQSVQRNKFRLAGYCWRAIDDDQRKNWLRAATVAGLKITGYNLFVYWVSTSDDQVILTIEQQSGITLLPLVREP